MMEERDLDQEFNGQYTFYLQNFQNYFLWISLWTVMDVFIIWYRHKEIKQFFFHFGTEGGQFQLK